MRYEVGKTYTTKEGSIAKIENCRGDRLLGYYFNTWVNYDTTGKCLDYDPEGERLTQWDLVPEAQYAPWTADTIPHQPFYVRAKSKDHTCGSIITTIIKDGVRFKEFGETFTYKRLLEDFVTIDGQPCGKKVS